MFCCLKGCPLGFSLTSSVPIRIKENPVQLDTLHMGQEVVVVKGGSRVCGSGCALGNAPLVQNKAYFEVKLQQGGVWAVGLATRETDLNSVHGGMDNHSWCLNSDGTVRHSNNELYHIKPAPRESPTADLLVSPLSASPTHTHNGNERDREETNGDETEAVMPIEGDTIGLAYDHVELNFFLNGKNMEIPVRNIRGTVFPALYVDDGAILDVILDHFLYPPPTGYEKIMAPLPAPLWLQPLEAIDKGIICPQNDIMILPERLNMQEECLIANVFVPDTQETRLPVVVYVHGGAYQIGFGNLMTPKSLVRSKKLIAVTFNYRVGVHGFLCLGTKDVPGNAGMKDQVAALRWIKKNIASFGGNPDDITVAGYSAGASAVDLLMLSKTTRGLFNRVIPESGSSLVTWSVQQQPLEIAKTYAKQLEFKEVDDLYALEEFYRTAPFEKLTSDSFLNRPDSSFEFAPCVELKIEAGEERFLDDAPVNIIKSGKYPKLPLLYGFANMEGLFRLPGYGSWKQHMNDKFSEFLPSDLHFQNEEEKEKVAKEVKAFYFKDKPIGDETISAYIDYFTDVVFAYGMLRAARLYIEGGHDKIYLYKFAYPHAYDVPESSPKKTISGASHCAQTSSVMDISDILPMPEDSTGKFPEIKELTRKFWINFITTGVPVPSDSKLPEWPPMSSKDGSPYMELNLTPVLREGLLKKRVTFWDGIYAKYYRVPSPPPVPPAMHTEL